LAGPPVPGLGYRVLVGHRAGRDAVSRLEPDILEVSDRTTLRWVGAWARSQQIPTVMVSHESLAGLLRAAPLPPSLRRYAGIAAAAIGAIALIIGLSRIVS
jgi:alpha-1,6-mannosyltransferase